MPAIAPQRSAPVLQQSSMRETRASLMRSKVTKRAVTVSGNILRKRPAHDAEKRRMVVSCGTGGAIDSTSAAHQEPATKNMPRRVRATESKSPSGSRLQDGKPQGAHSDGIANNVVHFLGLTASAQVCACAAMMLLTPHASAATVEAPGIIENILALISDASLSGVQSAALAIVVKALKTLGVRFHL